MPEGVLRLRDCERVPKRGMVGALVLALILAFSGVSHAQTVVRDARIVYYTDVDPFFPVRLCTGESLEIKVSINRLIYRGQRPTSPAGYSVGGGIVLGVISDEDVGQFDPPLPAAPVVGPTGNVLVGSQAHAVYTFVAKAPGQTTIEFSIFRTGEEAILGEGWEMDPRSLDVVVTDCFEAYTSGLGMFFTVKDMGDLIQPFTLEAFSPPTNGITTSSQAMFFMPSGPRNQFLPSFSGLYVSVISDTTQLGGVEVTCLDVLSGSYEVDFHITPDDPRFRSGIDVGNLLLFGKGSKYCQGRLVLSVNYVSDPGYQISFKPTVPPPP